MKLFAPFSYRCAKRFGINNFHILPISMPYGKIIIFSYFFSRTANSIIIYVPAYCKFSGAPKKTEYVSSTYSVMQFQSMELFFYRAAFSSASQIFCIPSFCSFTFAVIELLTRDSFNFVFPLFILMILWDGTSPFLIFTSSN